MTTLKDLEKRLEEATAGSVELDREINAVLKLPPVGYPSFTFSVDAALELCWRLLPGSTIDLSTTLLETEQRRWDAQVINLPEVHGDAGDRPTGALALCLAIIRALISKGGAGD